MNAIAIIISIISLALSIYKIVIDHAQNLLKISVEIKNQYFFEETCTHIFAMNFINETKNSVSIRKVVLHNTDYDIVIEANSNNTRIKSTENIKLKIKRDYYSHSLPINLLAYESKKVFLVFENTPILDCYIFKIYTNKGVFSTSLENYKLKIQQQKDLPISELNQI